ncbi:MAG TPA: GGDEF domain-containing protein [Methanocorpusculum sp.]|nr:GGDEF domain-containing protein [Methanocorpusculum sp.]
MSSFKNWLYGGKDKDFFYRHADEIRQANTKSAGTFSIVTTVIVLVFTLLMSITRIETDLAVLFVVSGILIVLNIYFWLWGRYRPKQTVYYVQVLLLVFTAFLMYRDAMEPMEYAVFIPLFLIVIPLIFINPMHKTCISMMVVLAAFIILSLIAKGITGYAIYDIIDACIAAAFGFFMGRNVLRLRISEIEAYDILKLTSDNEVSHAMSLANTDPLTGVRSRTVYENACKKLDERIRDGMSADFAVVVCDVNGLKATNDLKGHEAGDMLIKACCHEICLVFAHSPVFRIGGDEFAVILYDEDYRNRRKLLEELREANLKPGVSFAYGMSEYVADEDADVNTVFVRADAAMYLLKKEMKGCRTN